MSDSVTKIAPEAISKLATRLASHFVIMNSETMSLQLAAGLVAPLELIITEVMALQRQQDAQFLMNRRAEARRLAEDASTVISYARWTGFIWALEDAYENIVGEPMPDKQTLLSL